VTLALPDPTSIAVASAQMRCRELVEWANATDDLGQLDEARQWLSAVEEYLSHKNAEGPAQTAARLIEARIGDVLGPAENHGPSVTKDGLRRTERWEFRLMAERRNVWEDKLPLPRRRVLRLIRDDDADMRPPVDRPAELLSDIRLGDFRRVLADLPDESVDLILTDPPYPAEFLPLWSDLAIFAKRVLSSSGVMAAMSGQTHLPEVYRRLGEHLPYRWTMAYLMSGAANVVHARRVSTMWKPVLVYGSTDRRLHDVATSKAADKEYHGWGQSESGMFDLLRLLADPGATICDPFLGGGTTAVVAAAYGCHFIGAESDAEVHGRAVRRLAA
jgi:hypothetical protein